MVFLSESALRHLLGEPSVERRGLLKSKAGSVDSTSDSTSNSSKSSVGKKRVQFREKVEFGDMDNSMNHASVQKQQNKSEERKQKALALFNDRVKQTILEKIRERKHNADAKQEGSEWTEDQMHLIVKLIAKKTNEVEKRLDEEIARKDRKRSE